MNDCLLESENFQITKADNNKYLLLPVKKQPAEKIVLKECGKDYDKMKNSHSNHHFHQTPKIDSCYFNKTLVKKNITRRLHTLIIKHYVLLSNLVFEQLFFMCFIRIIGYSLNSMRDL